MHQTHTVGFLWCFVLLLVPCTIESVSVIGPRVLRPFSNYRVAVSGGPKAQTLFVAIEGRQGNGEQFSQGREVQVQPASSRIVDLDIGDPGPGHYTLIARSTAGPQFSSSAHVVYQPRSFCIFVQTDKRVYQPSDTIRFRVVALDKFLLPLSGTVDFSVIDSRGTPVRQWAGVSLDRGIVTREFALADEPGLGEWTIQVEAKGQIYSRQILVADYVLPKFNMQMQMPKQILFTDGRFNINVTAKHFNGLPVKGELTISAYAVFFSGLLQPVFSSPARKVVDFNGQADVIYDLKTDLDLAEDAARPLVVEAVLEEKDTLIKQNVSSRILLLRAPYRLKVSAPERFKPTLPYNVQIEVVEPSGEVMDVAGEVTVERLWDDGAPPNVTSVTLKNGLASYTLTPDKAHTNSTLNLLIKYKDVTERVVHIQRSDLSSGQYLTLEVLTRDTKVGDEMRARISASEPMDLVHYVVIARGDAVVAKTLELNPPRKSVDISVPVTIAMTPGSIILAWYPGLTQNTILPSAAVYAPHRYAYAHNLVIATSGTTYRLNGTVELRLQGEAGAHVALLGGGAGDSAGHGHASGLDAHTIKREVESFNVLKHAFYKNEDDLPTMGIDLGGYSSADVFENAGVVILTDSYVGRNNPAGEEPRQLPETGTRPPLAGPYAFSRLPVPSSPRYYLSADPQPTWMISNFTLDNEGKGTEIRRSPLSIGDWQIGGFSVHPTLGLSLATPQTFSTNVPLTITADLPSTLQKGETLAVIVTLKSSLTVDTSVELTFHNSDQFFEFEPLENGIDSAKKIELYRRLRLTVPARDLASTAFLVTAVKSGDAPIIVEATGTGVSASLYQTIAVKDGYETEVFTWGILDARRGVARTNISLVPVTQAGTKLGPISLVAAGDVLAPAIQAARSGPAPSSTPVQALRPLARSAILLDYLQKTGHTDDVALSQDARAQASLGFQRLVAYRKSDGSFASDLRDDSEGDIWMTSVSLRWLVGGSRWVQSSPAAPAAARWLAGRQRGDGSWPPPSPGPRAHPAAQAQPALTAHAAMALQALKSNEVVYTNAINKAVDYLARQLPDINDAYSLSVVGNVLANAKHPLAAQALSMMDKFANTTETTLFWSRKLSGNEWRNPWLRGNSLDASTAAFALKTMLVLKLEDQALPVANFLLQSNQPEDQDPDVFEALAQYALSIKSSTKLRVTFTSSTEELRPFSIDDDKSLILQSQPLHQGRWTAAITSGRGTAVVGLHTRGATNVTAPWPRYTLDPRVDNVSTNYRLQLSICFGFVSQANDTESGLALLTLQLPSGYLADIDTITELAGVRGVAGARLLGGGARLAAWVRARSTETCATVAAPRARGVARARAGWAELRDLADSSHRARVFFYPVSSSACDVCREWPSCARACGSAAQQVADGAGAGAGAGTGRGAGAGRSAGAATRGGLLAGLVLTTLTLLL